MNNTEQNTSLFSLSLDGISKQQLAEAAKWARIFSVAGMIVLGLILCNAFYKSSFFLRFGDGEAEGMAERIGAVTGALLVMLVPLLSLLFIFRFAKTLQAALATDDQQLLNRSFQNLKIYLRYVGILTILFGLLMAFSFALKFVTSPAGV